MHNLADIDVKIEKQHCIVHHIVKRPVAVPDALTERIAALNIILAYYKLNDDVLDNNKGRLKRSFFKSAYKKAKLKEPKLDLIVAQRYDQLREYEKANCDSIDIVADPFGMMMQEVVEVLLGEVCTVEIKDLAYNLGKWIYLIDALDDFDKDKKSKNFNVFVNAYQDVINKQTLVSEKRADLIMVFSAILSSINELTRQLNYKFNHDLTDNVLLRGINVQTKNIMENNKCKNTTKF